MCIVWAGCPSHHPSDTDLASGIVKGGGGAEGTVSPGHRPVVRTLAILGVF